MMCWLDCISLLIQIFWPAFAVHMNNIDHNKSVEESENMHVVNSVLTHWTRVHAISSIPKAQENIFWEEVQVQKFSL